MSVYVAAHPLIRHKLGLMRKKSISTKDFRDLAAKVALLLTYEATKDIETEKRTVVVFAIGHCLPIVVAGSSTAFVRRLTENSAWQGAGVWFRRGAGVVIALLGVYFIVSPWTMAITS